MEEPLVAAAREVAPELRPQRRLGDEGLALAQSGREGWGGGSRGSRGLVSDVVLDILVSPHILSFLRLVGAAVLPALVPHDTDVVLVELVFLQLTCFLRSVGAAAQPARVPLDTDVVGVELVRPQMAKTTRCVGAGRRRAYVQGRDARLLSEGGGERDGDVVGIEKVTLVACTRTPLGVTVLLSARDGGHGATTSVGPQVLVQ